MFNLENLLRNEYLPAELPPCFNSDSFADQYAEIEKHIGNQDLKPSDPLTFSGYKNENSRRKFAIPNPYQYARAAHIIATNASEIFDVYEQSESSLTRPVAKIPEKNECYKKSTKNISDSKEKIKRLYQNNLYEIRLDIQVFLIVFIRTVLLGHCTLKRLQSKTRIINR